MNVHLLYHLDDLHKCRFEKIYNTLSVLFNIIHFEKEELFGNELPYNKSNISLTFGSKYQ